MSRHKMPRRTKRRLIAAAIAATTLIGTGVVIGITGNAFAWGRRGPDLSVLECIPDVTNPSSSAAPPTQSAPPQQSSSAPAAKSGDAPAEPAPDQQAPDQQAPDQQAPDQQAPEQPAAEQPAAEQPAAEQPAQQQPAKPQGGVAPAAFREAQPSTPTPDKPAPPPAPNGGAATSPDEAGAPPPAKPDPQPQAEDVKQFTKPSCTDAFGPFPQDFVNILKVTRSNLNATRTQRTGSRGTFTSRCGTNQNHHNNPANFIVAPGNANGAHHLHDYVGNLSTDGNSTNESLAAAGTTCQAGDKSTYYWPVIRVRDRDGGGAASEAENPHNIGRVIQPTSAALVFRGNATSKVVAMPDFIRIITGDAKASINGGANGNAKWTCTGFTDRLTTKYPLCPRGSRLQRIADLPSCWDGKNIDSANHRTHVLFPDKSGACPAGTKAIPQLRITLTYDVPRGSIFAVDAFPEVQHSPITDHADFTNVMPKQLMDRAVQCINSGRNC
jgi:hypothetical protein